MPSLTVLLLVHGKVTSRVVSRYSIYGFEAEALLQWFRGRGMAIYMVVDVCFEAEAWPFVTYIE